MVFKLFIFLVTIVVIMNALLPISHKVLYDFFFFSIPCKVSSNFSVIYSLTNGLNFHFGVFFRCLLLLTSNLIFLWSEKILNMNYLYSHFWHCLWIPPPPPLPRTQTNQFSKSPIEYPTIRFTPELVQTSQVQGSVPNNFPGFRCQSQMSLDFRLTCYNSQVATFSLQV